MDFQVYCEKATTIRHIFTTDKHWKESRDLEKQGYRLGTITDTYVDAIDHERIDEPRLTYFNRFSFFEHLQSLYKSHAVHYPQCKWIFEDYPPLTSKADIESTLQVWDKLWDGIFEEIEEVERESKDKYAQIHAGWEEDDIHADDDRETTERKRRNREQKQERWNDICHLRYDTGLAEDVRTKVREILEYAATHDNIHVHTITRMDY